MGQKVTSLEHERNPRKSRSSNMKVSREVSRDDEVSKLREELKVAKMELRKRSEQLVILTRENHKLKVSHGDLSRSNPITVRVLLSQSVLDQKSQSVPAKLSGATKKCGVSGESFDPGERPWEMTIEKVEKDFRSAIGCPIILRGDCLKILITSSFQYYMHTYELILWIFPDDDPHRNFLFLILMIMMHQI